jgi:hypothetical protein
VAAVAAWVAHQVRSVVAATPTPLDHDSPNAPATARSVYVIVHAAARPVYIGVLNAYAIYIYFSSKQGTMPFKI